jgi:hydrogenase maturation factor
VDVVEVLACEAQTGAVDIVEEVENGKVELGREMKDLELFTRSLKQGQWHIIHHGI